MNCSFLPRAFILVALMPAVIAALSAQTLYVPSGTGGVGSSSTGNIGIGISNPNAKLQVVGDLYISQPSGSDLLRAFGPNTGFTFTDQSSYVQLRPYHAVNGDMPLQIGPGAGGLRIDTNGKVGIGTSSLNESLHTSYGTSSSPVLGVYNTADNLKLLLGTTTGSYLNIQGRRIDNNTAYNFSLQSEGGNVGIGTTVPGQKLTVWGNFSLGNATTGEIRGLTPTGWGYGPSSYRVLMLGASIGSESVSIGYDPSGNPDGAFTGDGREVLFRRGVRFVTPNAANNGYHLSNLVLLDGNVGIGTSSPTHKLAVNGAIRAKEMIVDTGWSDYVFANDYRLAPLSEVEAHIQAKKHLPGIPSAAEVEAQGVSIGEMQSRLLEKIEELTLHLIAQQKDIAAIKIENTQMRRRISALSLYQQPSSP